MMLPARRALLEERRRALPHVPGLAQLAETLGFQSATRFQGHLNALVDRPLDGRHGQGREGPGQAGARLGGGACAGSAIRPSRKKW